MLVKQIANLFALMDLFARCQKPLSVSEIVAALGWPRSSAFNIVETMVEYDFLYQPKARGGYYPTSKWLHMGQTLVGAQPIPLSVHQLLERLARETGETLFLVRGEGSSAVFEDVVESSADIRFIANVGQRLPIHVTAGGRAILAQYPQSEVEAVLKRIRYQRYEKDTFMTPESVTQEIERGKGRGWHINMAIYAPGVAGVAVPFNLEGRRTALALGGPESRIGSRIDELGELLEKAVAEFHQQNPARRA